MRGKAFAGQASSWKTHDTEPMREALALAEQAALIGEVPVGAVIVSSSGTIAARAHNRIENSLDPTAHAEILAIRAATIELRSKSLSQCDLYVTLEPCTMCAQAIAYARIRRLFYAASDPKGGGVEHGARVFAQPTCHHRPEVIAGLEAARAAALLHHFFTSLR